MKSKISVKSTAKINHKKDGSGLKSVFFFFKIDTFSVKLMNFCNKSGKWVPNYHDWKLFCYQDIRMHNGLLQNYENIFIPILFAGMWFERWTRYTIILWRMPICHSYEMSWSTIGRKTRRRFLLPLLQVSSQILREIIFCFKCWISFTAPCFRNFQKVKLRLGFVEIWSFYRHSDFTRNQILANSNGQKTSFSAILEVLNFDFSKFEQFSSPKFTKNSNQSLKFPKMTFLGLLKSPKSDFALEWR